MVSAPGHYLLADVQRLPGHYLLERPDSILADASVLYKCIGLLNSSIARSHKKSNLLSVRAVMMPFV